MKIIFMFLIALFVNSHLQAAQIIDVPNKWRLENNIPDRLEVWYSGSSCANGRLILPSTATKEDKNRFWSTIMAAKTSNKKVVVFYDENTAGCEVSSFGLVEE